MVVVAQRAVRCVVVLAGLVLIALLVLAFGPQPESQLTMPVQGFTRSQVKSSFGAPRGSGRQHHGIDLFAPSGTPVFAATSGMVVFKGWNQLGGRAVYVLGEGVLTYYAHLDTWRPGLHWGERVARGTRLGTVGTSGNASGTPPHLHFAVHPLANRFAAVDPAPRLIEAAAAAPRSETAAATRAPAAAAARPRERREQASRATGRRHEGTRHAPSR